MVVQISNSSVRHNVHNSLSIVDSYK